MTLLCGLFGCNGKANPPSGDNPDKGTMSIIRQADKVVYYSLDPLSEDVASARIGSFATTGFSKQLDKPEIDTLIALIEANAKIPKKKDAGKFSAFLPVDVFQFVRGKDTVNFFVDLHCDVWQIDNKKKQFSSDFDSLHERMSSLVHGIIGDNADSGDASNSAAVASVDMDKSLVPAVIQKVLQKTDSLVWYLLDPMQKADKGGFNGFYVLDEKQVADAAVVADITGTLLDKESFEATEMVKNCAFLPDLGIRVFSGKTYADVMFSFYCDECKIVCGDDIFQSDSKIIRKRILQLAMTTFPKDRYLRILLNK